MSDEAAAFEKNTKEQYEQLGRFVEAFEAMVHEVRESCIILTSEQRPVQQLLEVAFHHQNLTAKPLFDIMRALMAELLENKQKRREYSQNEKEAVAGTANEISTEYNALVNTRNNLLHGTWYIGYLGESDVTASEFTIRKYVTTKTGLKELELPKTARELRVLIERCVKARLWISHLVANFMEDRHRLPVEKAFRREGSRWVRITPRGGETLP